MICWNFNLNYIAGLKFQFKVDYESKNEYDHNDA